MNVLFLTYIPSLLHSRDIYPSDARLFLLPLRLHGASNIVQWYCINGTAFIRSIASYGLVTDLHWCRQLCSWKRRHFFVSRCETGASIWTSSWRPLGTPGRRSGITTPCSPSNVKVIAAIAESHKPVPPLVSWRREVFVRTPLRPGTTVHSRPPRCSPLYCFGKWSNNTRQSCTVQVPTNALRPSRQN